MPKNLVIVESPAKASTIKKYLGKGFTVVASYGHVRDLIPKNGAVDTEHDFAMRYQVIEKAAKNIAAITKAIKTADTLYLATDPDREGEAIAWHVYQILKEKKALKKQPVYRIVFHEITKSAIKEALEHPREISMNLVDAQQARRALDYLVGFNLSPLLWKKIRPGLSAGRVQSPALRMIVEREEEIEKFQPQEYWTIIAKSEFSEQKFNAKLIEYQSSKVGQFTFTSAEQSHQVVANLLDLAQHKLIVSKVDKKKRTRNPAPPFTTSTLQQEASRKLGFAANRTMRTAQALYEGVETGDGALGLITYMRTDSVNLSAEALNNIRAFIVERFGKDNLPAEPRFYKTKSKNAQEAHEAIRPTDCQRTPETLAAHLTPDQLKLYTLIWKRAIASQMINATLDTVAVDLTCGKSGNTFRANGSTITDPGFIAVYREDNDDLKADDDESMLPPMAVNDSVTLLGIDGEQHFTEPPPRYSEASLIKTLEEYGIGRPSTYVAIIDTLLTREYVTLENKRFKPTDVGRVVNKFLTNYFTNYVDYEYTAKLEDKLDEVARGENEFLPLLKEFWTPFISLINITAETVTRQDVTHELLEEKCPQCGKPLSIRLGKRGKFIGCTGYPECTFTRNIENGNEVKTPEITIDRKCPLCESALEIKYGRYGKFIGCSNYPQCKHIEPLEKPADTGVKCPECGNGTMLKRKSRYGKFFFSCSEYPKCKYATWYEPIAEKCPKCGWPILTLKITKRKGTEKACPQKDCGYSVAVDDVG